MTPDATGPGSEPGPEDEHHDDDATEATTGHPHVRSFRLRWTLAILAEPKEVLGPLSRLVALTLSTWMDQSGHCWPSVPSIAERAGLSKPTVRTRLIELTAYGFLERFWRGADGKEWIGPNRGGRVWHYQALIPGPVEQSTALTVGERADELRADSAQSSPLTVDGQSQNPNGQRDDLERSTGLTRTLQEPVTELAQENSSHWPPIAKNATAATNEEDEEESPLEHLDDWFTPTPEPEPEPELDEAALRHWLRQVRFTATELTEEQVESYAAAPYYRRLFREAQQSARKESA